jgi:hypothetical protein
MTTKIEAIEPEAIEEVYASLDKLVEVQAKLGSQDGDNIIAEINEVKVQQEIEEIFTELLERMGIEYTPELIEHLVHLTLKSQLAKKIKKPGNEEEIDEAPNDTGTHEAIKQLLLGLSDFKKAIAYAGVIGKSALHLCDFNLAG